MISKENFIKYIGSLKELQEIEDAINSAGRRLDLSIPFSAHKELILEILEDVFQDKKNGWINYYICELDFGSKWHELCILLDGVDVPMRDASELYDVLESNINARSCQN